MTSGPLLRRTLFHGFAILAMAYLMLPLIVIIGTSFTATSYLAFPPEGLTLKWYRQFLWDRSYLDAFALSGQLAVTATLTALLLGVPVALVLSRAKGRLSTMTAGLFVAPLVLPTIVLGAAFLQFASQLGFARSWLALYLGHTVLVIPYIVRTALASLSGFDVRLEEAALDLGAGKLSTFFRITLPIIKSGVIAGALFGFIISWVNVELSMFNATASLTPLPVKLFNYVQYAVDPMIAAVSASTIYLAVLIVVAIDLLIGVDRINGT